MKKDPHHQFAGIIPARYASSRFPGKPLVMIGNKPMIQRVYDLARETLNLVYVATDDVRIFDAVSSFGGKAIMTSPDHLSGTDRCAEAVSIVNKDTGTFVDIVTLIRKAEPGEDIFNPNQPKVILNAAGDAIYFSRAAMPFIRDAEKNEWSRKHDFYKHIGLYAYRTETLKKITLLPRSKLEMSESLEQNRWIENGYRIRTAVTLWESIGIDTPEDLE